MNKPLYLTTTLPYVNATPHLGHALEFVRSDVLYRYKKSQGFDGFFNTATDEHGQKIYDGAQAADLTPQEYVDQKAASFKTILPRLGVSGEIHFIRTTDERHVRGAQAFWKIVRDNGYIYK